MPTFVPNAWGYEMTEHDMAVWRNVVGRLQEIDTPESNERAMAITRRLDKPEPEDEGRELDAFGGSMEPPAPTMAPHLKRIREYVMGDALPPGSKFEISIADYHEWRKAVTELRVAGTIEASRRAEDIMRILEPKSPEEIAEEARKARLVDRSKLEVRWTEGLPELNKEVDKVIMAGVPPGRLDKLPMRERVIWDAVVGELERRGRRDDKDALIAQKRLQSIGPILGIMEPPGGELSFRLHRTEEQIASLTELATKGGYTTGLHLPDKTLAEMRAGGGPSDELFHDLWVRTLQILEGERGAGIEARKRAAAIREKLALPPAEALPIPEIPPSPTGEVGSIAEALAASEREKAIREGRFDFAAEAERIRAEYNTLTFEQKEALASGVEDIARDMVEPNVNWENANTLDERRVVNDVILDAAVQRGMSPQEYVRLARENLKAVLGRARMAKRTHLKTLSLILADGAAKTQHVTGVSSGTYAPDMRAEAEQAMFNFPIDGDPLARPAYGYLTDDPMERPEDESVEYYMAGVKYYGDVDLVLKESVRERATYVFSDSLGLTDEDHLSRYSAEFPAPLARPQPALGQPGSPGPSGHQQHKGRTGFHG